MKEPWYDTVIATVKRILAAFPRYIVAILRSPTGRRIVAGLLILGLRQIGITLPEDVLSAVLTAVSEWLGGGAVGSADALWALLATILLDGTLRANDGLSDLQAALEPPRYHPVESDPYRMRYRAGAQVEEIAYWDYDGTTLRAVTASGAYPVPRSSWGVEEAEIVHKIGAKR